ncbi:unnamed protein product [Vitrella brassicaformis CCMP3155]|uniref:Cytochrome c peroxidase, mitochondrial n=1 Tax=Vitrella brassicaformis (strain CCMP3155) TaxID=1169540 RepID=A0A0G4GEG9_VITBC|nr:unnamed protein product [Vitrella brassicaformis CCMP3155]|mmetsp:Transcript_27068/g.67451  ORF Transcript_27068/g.67451 Transcript_27068/m.67451 type:complete len:385 (-) Transcript_27068:249-1403(-)|eukprot:CEM27536.1 unnamed protein product [Vitrella brassicaformis CCMP3155]
MMKVGVPSSLLSRSIPLAAARRSAPLATIARSIVTGRGSHQQHGGQQQHQQQSYGRRSGSQTEGMGGWIWASAAGAMVVGGSSVGEAMCELPKDKSDKVDWKAVRADICKLLEDDKYEKEPPGPVLVRLAWHASGTYDSATKTGGSNGATMRFTPESTDGANAGLHIARNMLAPIKDKYPNVSLADLWIFAGVTAIEEMGGPSIEFRPGRTDAPDASTVPPNGRLPDADKGQPNSTCQHIRDIFGRMGFNDQEMVALSGAHALGRCHTDRSGYWGPWTRAPTTFSNEYFRLLMEEKWSPKKTHEGKKWTGPLQYEDPTGELMMLPSDIALIQDKEFKRWVEVYAKDEDRFFKDFARAFKKLTELGVSFPEDDNILVKLKKLVLG